MTKFFKKSKKTYFGAILGPFCPNLGKNEFSFKKGLCQFLNIPIIYSFAKSQKKLMSHSCVKCRTVGRTIPIPIPRKLQNRMTDRPYRGSYKRISQLRGIAVGNKNKIQCSSAWHTSLT